MLEYSAPVLRPAENPFNFDLASHNGPMSKEMVERARYKLQREGYCKADVSLNDLRPIGLIGGTIALTLAIEEGQQFHLQQIGFSGNKELPESQLRQQFEIADGDVFDVEQIRKGLEPLRDLPGLSGELTMYLRFSGLQFLVATRFRNLEAK